MVHLGRLKGGARKLLRISELVGLRKRHHYVVRDIFTFEQTGIKDGEAKVPGFLDDYAALGLGLLDLFEATFEGVHLEWAERLVRRMIAELDRRFPGLGHQIDEGMAVAIDGEIFQDAYQAELGPDSEVVLIPKIGGG